MATRGGYIVLATYESSSSDKIYEVRRGGDSVLYCTCRGWVASREIPRACKHCKDYVRIHPGTPYSLVVGGVPATATSVQSVVVVQGKRKPSVVPVAPLPTVQAAENWRDLILAERAIAVKTPREAQAAFDEEISRFANLDLGG